MRPVNFRKRYYHILEAANLKQRRLHTLRRTFATNLVDGIRQPDGTIRVLSPGRSLTSSAARRTLLREKGYLPPGRDPGRIRSLRPLRQGLKAD